MTELILAVDVKSRAEALALAEATKGPIDLLKIGLELFSAEGPSLVRDLVAQGHRIMLDLKLHDIPNTVAQASARCADLGVELLTLHALGGPAMIAAALESTRSFAELKLLPVTVLTSMDQPQLFALGIERSPAEQVQLLAEMALKEGAQGLVCSPQELRLLRQQHGEAPHLVCPGVRPAGAKRGDQKRTARPEEAQAWGASAIVVGRPIRSAHDPQAAAQAIRASLQL